jgi:hypothetical protein
MRNNLYTYVVCELPRKNFHFNHIMIPENSKQVKMAHFKKIIAPSTINLSYNKINNEIVELYDTNVSINNFYNSIVPDEREFACINSFQDSNVIVLTNILIESNYEMIIGSNNIIDGKLEFNILKKGTSIRIDMMMDLKTNRWNSASFIYLDKSYENSYDKQPYFKMSCSILVYGHDFNPLFENVCFKLNPLDPDSQYMKTIRNTYTYESVYSGTNAMLPYTRLTDLELHFLNPENKYEEVIHNLLDSRDKTINNENCKDTIPDSEIDRIFSSIGAFSNVDKYIGNKNEDIGLGINN